MVLMLFFIENPSANYVCISFTIVLVCYTSYITSLTNHFSIDLSRALSHLFIFYFTNVLNNFGAFETYALRPSGQDSFESAV